ncbi:MAG: hypothetical protein ACOVOQ_01850 [Flavobacterium sp.]
MHTDYYNPIGLIFDGNLYINKKDTLIRLECQQVRNVYFKKEKVLSNNIRLLIVSLMLFSILLGLGEKIALTYQIVGYAIATILVTRYYNYIIIIITKNQDVIKTSIEPEYKDDAKELISRIKQNIKSQETVLKAI